MIEGDLFRDNSEAFRRAVNEVTGIDGVIVKFDGREHRIAWFPEQIRSVNAAFDPDFADEPTLLAQQAADIGAARRQLSDDPSSLDLDESAAASINPIYRPEVLPPQRMKGSNREAAQFLEDTYTDEPITDFTAEISPERLDRIATQMAAETQLALASTGNAFDWYSAALDRTLSVAAVKYPMLTSDAAAQEAGLGTAANARFLFTYIMATTSQNLDVAANAKATDAAFGQMIDRWRAGNYTMDTERWGTGDKKKAMNINFAKFNEMLPKMPGKTIVDQLAAMDEMFRASRTVSEWTATMKAADIPYSPPGQTAKDAIVYGSSTLGPKIGNGFWQNLNGNFNPLTIDLWMRRTWGRLTGKSIGLEEALPGQRKRLSAAVKRSRSKQAKTDEYVAGLEAELANVRQQLAALSPKAFATKKTFNAEEKRLKAEEASLTEIVADAKGVKAPEPYRSEYNSDNEALLSYVKRLLKVWDTEYKRLVAKHGKDNVPDDMQPTWARAAKTIKANLGSPLDQVANGTQRQQIEKAGQLALQKLAARGIDVTMADMQALLWYPEKELWTSLTRKLDIDDDGVPIPIASNLNESYDAVFTRILGEQGYDIQAPEQVEGAARAGAGRDGDQPSTEQLRGIGERIEGADGEVVRRIGTELQQELEAPGERGPRGLTRVPGPLGTGTVLGSVPTLVKLTEAKDKTTFLHESAHVFLEVFAALEDTNPEIAAEMAPVREWLGWEKGKPLTVEMHEKFAGLDGFEGYLSTGKAPAPELRSVFEQFRNWFVKVYEKLRGREIKIDQRARDFFDRMLATEQEIANAERSYHDVLTETMRGLMTPEQVEKHSKLAERAGRVARDRIFKKHLEQIMRRDRKTYKEAKRRIEEDVRAKLEDLPIFRALAELADEKSPVVLNRAVTEEIVGPDNMAPLEPYVSEEGIDPEGFALSMGFASADEMFQEIASNPDFDIAVEYETRRRLDDLEDDLLVNPDRAEQEAIEATFNDAQVRKLEVERDALAQRALQEPIPLQAIRRRARDVIDNTPINEVIKPGRYAMQAQSLHKKAVKAAAKGQFDVALRLTHQAMMQHELARYAYKARSEIEKINRFLARFGRTRKLDPKRIAPEFIDPIRTLMAMPGAADQTAARSVLVQFEALKAQDNIMLELPVEIFTQENLPDRRKMTLQQFRSFRDGVKSLNKNGRDQSDVEKAKRAARNQAMADIVYAAWGKRKLKEPTRSPKFMERLMSGITYFDSVLIRLPFLAEILQGNQRDGPLYDILWRDFAVAYNRTEDRHFRQIDQLSEILNRHNITARELNRLINEPLLDRNPIHKEKLFVILLNMGNAGNIQRISDDPSLPDQLRGDPQAILQLLERRLEKRHFDAAQEIWDLLEQDRDDLGVVHQRRTGVIPTWVEPQELVTKYGTYKGGYYPIKYRPGVVSNSDIKEREVENLFAEFSGGGVSKAQTRSGMVQTRVESQKREMSWDFNNIITHMRDTAVMIEMSEPVDNAWSLISSSAFKTALEKTWGNQYQKTLETIIKRIAADATIHETENAQPYNKMMRLARVNASIAILGLNVPTALLAPVSYFQTVFSRYDFKVVARGWIEWFGRYNARFVKSKKTMEQKSPFMAERARLINREATDIAKRQVFSGKWSAVQGSGYVPMAVVEKHTVGGALWWGVYRTAKMKGLSEPQAIADADTAIATTQGGGRIMDQSIIQGASSEFDRALTFMWGFVSGYYGVVRTDLAGAETGLRKTAQLVKHFMVLNTFAAILENLIRDPTALFDEDDEEATFLFNVLKTMGRNMLIIPGASAAFSRYYNAPQLEQLSKDTQQTFNYGAKTVEDYFENGEVDGEMAWKATRRALETAGFALGVPGTLQAGRALDVLEQLEEEDEDPSFETFYRALVAGPKDDS